MDVRSPQRLIAGVAIGIAGFVHFRIWEHEYRHAPVREMFIANWAVSAVMAALLVVTAVVSSRAPRLAHWTLLGGLVLAVGSLVAFGVSRGPGLPTLHGNFKETTFETTASYLFGFGSAKAILIAETIGAVLCGALLVQENPLPGLGQRRRPQGTAIHNPA